MNTKIHLKNKHTIAQLQSAVKTSKDESQKTRLRALIQLKKGHTRTATAKEFVIDRKTLLFWIKTYNKEGVRALIMSKGGRPEGNPIWDKKIFNDLLKEVEKSKKCWSMPLMQEWIRKHKKKEIPESTIWYHLQLSGFTYTSLRPHPHKGDKKAQKAFKKRG